MEYKPRTSFMSSKHLSNWAISLSLAMDFSTFFLNSITAINYIYDLYLLQATKSTSSAAAMKLKCLCLQPLKTHISGQLTELQIRWVIKDNSKIAFLISKWKQVVTNHLNLHDETVLLMGHKICFYGEMGIIIPKWIQLSLLIWSSAQ